MFLLSDEKVFIFRRRASKFRFTDNFPIKKKRIILNKQENLGLDE